MIIPERVKGLQRKPTPILVERFGPMKRIRAISTGNMIAEPHAAAMMADFGAEVIHIEIPGVGDTMRALGPFIPTDSNKVSSLWADNARNRLSMELDLNINYNPKSNQPYDLFQTSDGYAAVGAFSAPVFRRFTQAMAEATGINPDDYPPEECTMSKEAVNSPKGLAIDKIFRDWAKKHTKKEVSALLDKYQVPCGPVYTAKDACEDSHWIDRDNFVECIDQTIQKKIKIFGINPKFSETPGKVWRGAPALGQDTEDILTKILDYTPEEINQLREEKTICR